MPAAPIAARDLWRDAFDAGLIKLGPCEACGERLPLAPLHVRWNGARAKLCRACTPRFQARQDADLGRWMILVLSSARDAKDIADEKPARAAKRPNGFNAWRPIAELPAASAGMRTFKPTAPPGRWRTRSP